MSKKGIVGNWSVYFSKYLKYLFLINVERGKRLSLWDGGRQGVATLLVFIILVNIG